MGIPLFPCPLTCLYHLPDQKYAALQHVPLNDHTPMSESESEQTNTLEEKLVVSGYH